MDHYNERQQRRNLGNQPLRSGAMRKYDQEIGAFGRADEFDDLNTDFEVGGLTSDLEAGLKPEFEIGELEQNYELPADEQHRQHRRKHVQRTQRQQDDR